MQYFRYVGLSGLALQSSRSNCLVLRQDRQFGDSVKCTCNLLSFTSVSLVTFRYRVIALHSVLTSQDQNEAFDVPPSGCRKIVIATNIAETGITIPDVVFVIDTGKVKENR